MKYICDMCDYATNNKSNFNKHNNSISHKQKIIIEDTNVIDDKEIQHYYNCECGKNFIHASGLSRHKKRCNGSSVVNEIKELKEQLQTMNQYLLEYSKNTKITNNTYISVKNHINYIKENYSSAPVLTALDDYTVINKDDELLDNLVYYHNHDMLNQYLGDFLIKYYKKEDSTKQSIWNSDVSRVTYVIKELLANKKSIWNHDYKGIKTKEFIISPLLEYIKTYINQYINNFKFDMKMTAKQCEKIAESHMSLSKILQYINTDLAEDVIKYIAPHFHLNKAQNLLTDELLLIDCD